MSGCDREVNAHFNGAASLEYHVSDIFIHPNLTPTDQGADTLPTAMSKLRKAILHTCISSKVSICAASAEEIRCVFDDI